MAFVPKSVASDDNYTVLFVPAIADPEKLKVAEVTAAGAVDLTYAFTADGFAPSGDQEVNDDDRLTLGQKLQSLGKKSMTIEPKYVFNPESTADDIARQTLAEGTEGFFVERPAVPHDTAWAADQTYRAIPVRMGAIKEMSHESGAPQTISQACAVIGEATDLLKVVA